MRNETKIECVKSLKMLNGEKRTAFIEGNFYILKEKTERSISLINEQGYIHTIDGECLEYFKIPANEK